MSDYYKNAIIKQHMVGQVLDPAFYCHVHDVSGMGLQAIKKISHGGKRGAKDKITDLKQAIVAIERMIELEEMELANNLDEIHCQQLLVLDYVCHITVKHDFFEGELCYEATVEEFPDLADYGDSREEVLALIEDSIQQSYLVQSENLDLDLKPANMGSENV